MVVNGGKVPNQLNFANALARRGTQNAHLTNTSNSRRFVMASCDAITMKPLPLSKVNDGQLMYADTRRREEKMASCGRGGAMVAERSEEDDNEWGGGGGGEVGENAGRNERGGKVERKRVRGSV